MADNTFLGSFVTQYARLVLPLDEALQSEAALRELFFNLGWKIPNPPVTQAQTVVNRITTLSDDLENLPASPSEIDMVNLLIDISQVYTAVKNFANAIAGTTTGIAPAQNTFKAEFPGDLFNYLIYKYLQSYYKEGFNVLKATGIVTFSLMPASSPRPSYTKIKINYAKFGTLITNPVQLVKSVVDWNTSNYSFENVSKILFNFLNSLGVPAILDSGSDIEKSTEYQDAFGSSYKLGDILSVYLLSVLVGNEYKTFLAQFSAFEGNATNTKGMILEVAIPQGTNLQQDITDTVSLELNTNKAVGNNFAIQFSPSTQKFKYLSNSADKSRIEFLIKNQFETPVRIFGQREGTRLELRNQTFSFFTTPGDPFEFGLGYDLSGLVLVIDPENSDNFIKKVFGDKKKEIQFPLMIQWSDKKGISFQGSGSFEFSVNTHFKIGPIEFTDVKIGVQAPQGQDKVVVNVGTNVKSDLGVIAFNIDNLGLRLTFNLKEGNAGPFGIDIGFKPPTGVGLAIDAPPVTGGGFLNYDEATSTYTGGLELKFSKISFSAIGIINTKLPAGESGYSLLIVVSAEFSAIQLGMGFTLNGIGGLMGLHRTSNPTVLRDGVKNNSLNNILFPKNVIQNANAIISGLGHAFPIRKDQFVMGPMAKIGWGTPSLLTIDLGIVIELPDPLRLLILGVLRAQLPSSNNAILRLQVNFLGVIDFKEKYLSFDASLFDSKLLSFGLYGDMALRMNWGSRPQFLLSVGGFHPAYSPPPMNLPWMDRLTVVLVDGRNMHLSVETYFAVTSNSAQFGARVYAWAKAWKIKAIGELRFDALFQFSPFYFIATMGASFAVMMGRRRLLGLYIELELEGPDPWRASGYGSFKILFVRVRVRLNATIGRQRVEAISAVKVDPKIKEALLLPDNWEAILPERNRQLVTWRKEKPTEAFSVDPAGAIQISQRIMPLNVLMQKFGAAAISDFNKYNIQTVSINNTNLPIQRVTDYFARNEFANMSDQDKLSRDGYELFDSGVIVGSGDNLTSQYAVHKACAYEDISLDTGYRWHALRKYLMTLQHMKAQTFWAYNTDKERVTTISTGPNRIKLSVADGEFVFANRNNLKQVGTSMSFANSVQAEQYLQQQRINNPQAVQDWIVANRYELVH